jgi:tRNA 2-thiouridine synthesizing protein A
LPSDPDIIDARDQKCPLPVLRLEKRIASTALGSQLIVLATDPMARIDIPLFCRQNGHSCTMTEVDGVYRFAITKAPATPVDA